MIAIFGFGRYARELFNRYDVCIEEIRVIVDKNPNILFFEKRNPWLISSGEDNIIQFPVISWETYLEKKEDYQADYAVIGSRIYADEISRKLIENKAYCYEEIIPIKKWISKFPHVLGGWTKETRRLLV